MLIELLRMFFFPSPKMVTFGQSDKNIGLLQVQSLLICSQYLRACTV